MRDYAKVSPKFWTGDTGKKIRKLGRDAQVVAMYVLSCPSSNWIGLYYLPLPTLCHEVGISPEGALKALRSLSEGGFAHYDEDSEVVWVPEMARFQIGDSVLPRDLRHKGIIKELEEHKKSGFYGQFYRRYARDFNLPGPSPFVGPSKPLQSQEQEREQESEQEHEQEQEQEQEKEPPASGGGLSLPPTALFAELWDSYPRQESRAKAEEAFRKLQPDREVLARMLAWIAEAKLSEQWQDAAFIPFLGRWLNERRWEEKPPPRAREGRPKAGRESAAEHNARVLRELEEQGVKRVG